MRNNLFILFFTITTAISAQMDYGRSTWFIKGNATSLLDLITFPTVQLSVEKEMTDYISLSAEGGYQFYNFLHTDTSFLHPRGFKASLEFRYYLTEFISTRLTNKLGRVYAGFRPFFSFNRFNASISYSTLTDPDKWFDDDYAGKNMTFGANGILGFQKSIRDKIIIDVHGGLGIMYRDITNSEILYRSDSGYVEAGTEFIRFLRRLTLSKSSGIWPNLLFGVRVGVKL